MYPSMSKDSQPVVQTNKSAAPHCTYLKFFPGAETGIFAAAPKKLKRIGVLSTMIELEPGYCPKNTQNMSYVTYIMSH
jgi:hypothetical protein